MLILGAPGVKAASRRVVLFSFRGWVVPVIFWEILTVDWCWWLISDEFLNINDINGGDSYDGWTALVNIDSRGSHWVGMGGNHFISMRLFCFCALRNSICFFFHPTKFSPETNPDRSSKIAWILIPVKGMRQIFGSPQNRSEKKHLGLFQNFVAKMAMILFPFFMAIKWGLESKKE